jgi:non-heme chloroperoxidase
MPYVTVGKENGTDIDIYYKDWGKGQPIMFSHGWPLSGDDWTRKCCSSSLKVIG